MRTDQPFHAVCQPGSPSDVRARNPPSWATPRRKARLLPQKGSVAPEAFGRSLKLGREDLERRDWGVRRCGAVAPGGIAQRQKADGDDRQRPEQRHQPIRLREPALLGPAPRFPRFVKLLHDPPPGVPSNKLERLIEALNRTRRQQQPLEPVVPDPHTPDPDRRAPPGAVAGRQKLKL